MRRAGVSLIEVLVAIAILAIVLVAVVPAFVYYLQTNTKTEVRTQAVALAQEALEHLRLLDPSYLPSSGAYPPFADYSSPPPTCNAAPTACQVTRRGRTYTVRVVFCPGGSGLCGPHARHVRVEVDQGGKEIYAVETVFTKLR